MEIKLSRKREEAFWAIGIFILIVLLLLLGGFLTFGAKAKKIKPRQLPPEDTNAVNIIQMPWYAANAPTPQATPPSSSLPPPLISFTNELAFPWYYGMDGWLLIWRTPDWQNYEMLSYVLFEDECRFRTNSAGEIEAVIGFVDLFPLPERAFYEGVIITNSSP